MKESSINSHINSFSQHITGMNKASALELLEKAEKESLIKIRDNLKKKDRLAKRLIIVCLRRLFATSVLQDNLQKPRGRAII